MFYMNSIAPVAILRTSPKQTELCLSVQEHALTDKESAMYKHLRHCDHIRPIQLTQNQNQHLAMYSCNTHGPTFGNGHGICISSNALYSQASYTRCGYTYSVPSGYSAGDCGFFTGGLCFTPNDIGVFYEIVN